VFRKVIVGFNGTDLAYDGLELARLLAAATDAGLLVACVYAHHYPYFLVYDYETERRAAESMVSEAIADLGADAGADPRTILAASPAAGLHDLAEREQADLIVLGSSHRGALGRVLAGSVAERLLHGSPCAVAVAPKGFRERSHPPGHVIAVAFDGSPESHAAIAAAAGLARTLEASIRVLAVFEPDLVAGFGGLPPAYDRAEVLRAAKEHLERELERALAGVPGETRAEASVLAGRPAEVLSAETSRGVDLLVTGSRGYGPLGRVLLGSVSAELMRSAHCPVLVLPRSIPPEPPAGQASVTARPPA
jgi:nucleotide-binding universal stress UspA family protein